MIPRHIRAAIPDNPARALVPAWGRAIDAADRHARTCKRCAKRRVPPGVTLEEPYRFCRKAVALHVAERGALAAYLAAGGRLPVERRAAR